jgi:outer membrane protein assembly factor BamB
MTLIGGVMRTSVIVLTLATCVSLHAEDWPRFRGPNGTGVSSATGLPAEFGPAKNLVWKTKVPFARSSPIVVGNRVFVTAVEGEKLVTICLRRDNGEVVWRRDLVRPRVHVIYRLNDSAAPTPAGDETGVYAFFPEYGLVSYTLDGKERWRTPLGPFQNFYGMAGSPVVAGDAVILACDQQRKSFLLAVDKKTGRPRWNVERPDMLAAWATPAVYVPPGGEAQLVLHGMARLDSYALKNGERLWWVRGTGFSTYGVGALDGDRIFVNGSGFDKPFMPAFAEALKTQDKNGDGRLSKDEVDASFQEFFPGMDNDGNGFVDQAEWNIIASTGVGDYGLHAIRLGGRGDVTKTHVLWRLKKNLPDVPSPLVYQNVIYLVKDGGIITSVDPGTGKILKEGRTKDAMNQYLASPVAADGKVYLTSEDGKITVLKAGVGGEWEILAVNDLGEQCYATPALAAGRIVVRTREAVYSFETRK